MSAPVYDERLVAPAWVWAAALALALVAAASVHAGADGAARAVAPYVLAPVVALGAVLLGSRGRVRVHDGMLSVPGARIPLAKLGDAVPLDREATRQMRGPSASPEAFVVTRAWLDRSVVVPVEDPDDDTPYWQIGSRRPEALAAALAGSGDGTCR